MQSFAGALPAPTQSIFCSWYLYLFCEQTISGFNSLLVYESAPECSRNVWMIYASFHADIQLRAVFCCFPTFGTTKLVPCPGWGHWVGICHNISRVFFCWGTVLLCFMALCGPYGYNTDCTLFPRSVHGHDSVRGDIMLGSLSIADPGNDSMAIMMSSRSKVTICY